MRRLAPHLTALTLAAALGLAAGAPALASHHSGGGGHSSGGAHGGGGAHASAPHRDFLGRNSHGPDAWQVLRFLNKRRPYGPHNADNSGPPHFYGGRFLGYADGDPYYCSNGHRVHWDRGAKHWLRWGAQAC